MLAIYGVHSNQPALLPVHMYVTLLSMYIMAVNVDDQRSGNFTGLKLRSCTLWRSSPLRLKAIHLVTFYWNNLRESQLFVITETNGTWQVMRVTS